MNPRDALRRGRALALEWSGANARARQRLDGTRAAIAYYHRVLPEARVRDDAVEIGMYVTPETFGRHLDWLRAHFRVLPLHEVVDRLAEGRSLPPRACAICFDDGWRDNFEFALPELKRRSLPATIFVVTDRIGTEGAFWPDELCRRLQGASGKALREIAARVRGDQTRSPIDAVIDGFKNLSESERAAELERLRETTADPPTRGRELLDWHEVDALAADGIDIESHGATHAILTQLSDDRLDCELRTVRDRLLERGHGRHGLFAYPSGAFDVRVARRLGESGHRAAFTVERGLVRAGADLLTLPRLGLHECISRSRAEFLSRVPGRST